MTDDIREQLEDLKDRIEWGLEHYSYQAPEVLARTFQQFLKELGEEVQEILGDEDGDDEDGDDEGDEGEPLAGREGAV